MPESCSASVMLKNNLLVSWFVGKWSWTLKLISCKLFLIPRMWLTFCTMVVVQGLPEQTTYRITDHLPRSGYDSCRVNDNVIPLLAVGWNWVHGLVQPPYSSVWCGATGEDYRCLPWPVFMVWSRQEASVSSMGKTSWHRASTTFDVQMVPRLEEISWCSLNFG